LGCIGEAAKDAVPALKAGLNDRSKKVQRIAEWALNVIEDQGKEKR
jgi:hypothetical protein